MLTRDPLPGVAVDVQLFATNLGDEYLPSTLPTTGGTLHWSVTRSSGSGETFIKVVIPPLSRFLRFCSD